MYIQPLMNTLLLIAITLVFSAFFSGMEIAFLSSNKLKIELDKQQGVFSARLLSDLVKHPSHFIGTLLVGNNIAVVVYGVAMAKVLEPVFFDWGMSNALVLIAQTLVSTLLILIAAEFIPKTLFQANPNFVLTIFTIPMKVTYYILWIPMYIMVGLSNIVLYLFFGLRTGKKELVFGRLDLKNYVREITETAEKTESELDHEIHIFQNALDFSNVKARDCMVPRTEIVAVALTDDLEKLRTLFIDTGHSKILVYRDSIDHIIGYVNSVEMFNDPDSIKRLIVPVIIIPEAITAKEVLELFIKQNKSLAVIVDEFGGTSGILTIEDIIEEIFGDIEDEHDMEKFFEEVLDENTYNFSARLEIDYLNEKYRLNIPKSDDYETLAGYILHNFEHIPDQNSELTIDQFRFKITGATNVRIETVQLHVIEEE